MRRFSIIVMLITLAVLTSSGCGAGGTPPEGSDLRSRLARALEPTDPEAATMVRDESRTTLTELPAEWLAGWTLIDVLHRAANHPRRMYAALSDRDTVTILTRNPQGFNSVVQGTAGPTTDQAAEIARTYVDVTRDFSTWSYRVERIEDIEWLPEPDADQVRTRDQVIKEFAAKITPPRPAAAGDGWSVVLWTVTGTDLVRHTLVVNADGTVDATAIVVEEGIPVPASS